MRHVFLAALLARHLVHGLSSQATSWGRAQPRSIGASRLFEGDDGHWSTFGVTIGSPGQSVRLLPATSVNAVWPVVPEGCVAGQDPVDCPTERGSVFDPSKSSTWVDIGIYHLGLYKETPLGYSGNAEFGFDNVVLGIPGSGVPKLTHQVIEGFATKEFYIGALGLYPASVNITSINNSSKSLLGSLRAAKAIPGTSWSYTAGSSTKNVWGSLVFGGYDSTRFIPNNLSIPFSPSNAGDIVVGITRITNSSGSNLLPGGGIAAYLDSLIPDMWLPESACKAFETAFNLTWDAAVHRYLLDANQQRQLISNNASITFEIHDPATIALSKRRKVSTPTAKAVTITMQYGSFILPAKSPFASPASLPSPTVHYFPLRRARDATQYVLGRAFFQNAYVIADYDRGNFSVSQALFPSAYTAERLVPIHAPGENSKSGNHGASSGVLSLGAIVGIAVAAVALALVVISAWLFFRRRKRKLRRQKVAELEGSEKYGELNRVKPELDGEVKVIQELPGSDSADFMKELYGEPRTVVYAELPGSEVTSQELDSTAIVFKRDVSHRSKGLSGSDVPSPETDADDTGETPDETSPSSGIDSALTPPGVHSPSASPLKGSVKIPRRSRKTR